MKPFLVEKFGLVGADLLLPLSCFAERFATWTLHCCWLVSEDPDVPMSLQPFGCFENAKKAAIGSYIWSNVSVWKYTPWGFETSFSWQFWGRNKLPSISFWRCTVVLFFQSLNWPLPWEDSALASCRNCSALTCVLLGQYGGPQWGVQPFRRGTQVTKLNEGKSRCCFQSFSWSDSKCPKRSNISSQHSRRKMRWKKRPGRKKSSHKKRSNTKLELEPKHECLIVWF